MGWRLAKSLSRLASEIKANFPGTTIWSIGDQAHQSGYSDHNPNQYDIVCAIDIKGDGGLNLTGLTGYLVTRTHPNLRYVIFNRKIYSRSNDFKAKAYHGANPHTTHVHVSVGNGPDGRSTSNYDNNTSWGINNSLTPPKPKPPTQGWTDKLMAELPTLRYDSNGSAVKRAQALLNVAGGNLAVDGDYGTKTRNEVRDFQQGKGLAVDGVIGRNTWTRLVKG